MTFHLGQFGESFLIHRLPTTCTAIRTRCATINSHAGSVSVPMAVKCASTLHSAKVSPSLSRFLPNRQTIMGLPTHAVTARDIRKLGEFF